MNTFRRYLLFLLFCLTAMSHQARENDTQNAREAKQLFMKVYDMTFGDKGSSLCYSINIIGLYKTKGWIVYKGDKVRYIEDRYCAWENGVTAYMVDKKKRKVDIYRADDDAKDEYLAKFKYDINDFTFSYRTTPDYYEITAKVKNAHYFGIREVVGLIDRQTLYPVSLNIKVAFLHATVKITHFSPGNIEDETFVFPRSKFANYKFTDHR